MAKVLFIRYTRIQYFRNQLFPSPRVEEDALMKGITGSWNIAIHKKTNFRQ